MAREMLLIMEIGNLCNFLSTYIENINKLHVEFDDAWLCHVLIFYSSPFFKFRSKKRANRLVPLSRRKLFGAYQEYIWTRKVL